MGDRPTATVTTDDALRAAILLRPVVEDAVRRVDGERLTNEQKHAAVVAAVRPVYEVLQKQEPWLALIPFELVADLLGDVGTGLIAGVVNVLRAVAQGVTTLGGLLPSTDD